MAKGPLDEPFVRFIKESLRTCNPVYTLFFNQSCSWLFPQTPTEGASISVYAAAASELEGVGSCYLYNGEKKQSSESSYDPELQAKLWEMSCELVGLNKRWTGLRNYSTPSSILTERICREHWQYLTATRFCFVSIPKYLQPSPYLYARSKLHNNHSIWGKKTNKKKQCHDEPLKKLNNSIKNKHALACKHINSKIPLQTFLEKTS